MTELLTPLHIIFYLFSTVAVGSALVVIGARNPVHSVLALVVTFFAMAGVWMLLRAEFLSLILLLVYVGAVMTLFLFVVMMLNITREAKLGGFVRYLPVGLVIIVLVTALTMAALAPQYFGIIPMPVPAAEPANYSNITQVGTLLYSDYVYPVEIGGALLLSAMVAAIALTHRGMVRRKSQDISKQVNVRPEDRVRLIKMPSEPKQGE